MQLFCPCCGKIRTNIRVGLYRCDNCKTRFRINNDLTTSIVDLTLNQKIRQYFDSIIFIILNICVWILPYLFNRDNLKANLHDFVINNCIYSTLISLILPIALVAKEFLTEAKTLDLFIKGLKGEFDGLVLRDKLYAKTMRFFFWINITFLILSLLAKLIK